ncbi:MAG TPA: kelch repeat-containing protein, partial [Candidatus Polarisedimenticolaceae bacterium]|nr:kelch repeat-containing protein [Candidatus Polarisedimenticolaceae bacterium]
MAKYFVPSLAVAVVVAGGHVDAARSLSVEERVAAQRAVDSVYWHHRTWPESNPGPKPSLSEVLPDAQIEAKVADALRKSDALRSLWSRPLTTVQLQAELDRMAAETRAPEVLREIFAALDNDPSLIVETLVRPSLADRALRGAYAHDERFHGETARRAREAAARIDGPADMKLAGGDYREVKQPRTEVEALLSDLPVGRVSSVTESEDGFRVTAILSVHGDDVTIATLTWPKESFDAWWSRTRASIPVASETTSGEFHLPTIVMTGGCGENAWATGSTASSLPDARRVHTAVWTGSEMIIWGGEGTSGCSTLYYDSGGRFDPVTNLWTTLPRPPGILARSGHTAVWTGTEMIVWGGIISTGTSSDDGARYDPSSNTWHAVTMAGAPSPRFQHTAVWTGSRMIVWGGSGSNTGGQYDPETDTWSATSTAIGVPAARSAHTAVWTGSQMIVWGGGTNTGGRYDPVSDTWSGTSTDAGVPSARSLHTAVWTGSRMIVWGGLNGATSLDSGATYDPVADSWSPTPVGPSGRYWHSVVWTGSKMIVWGGRTIFGFVGGGSRYDPSTGTWSATSFAGAPPSARAQHTAVWTGTRMIVWGGNFSNGASYDPVADSWVATSGGSGLAERVRHTAVWTGAEMIVWGGN